MEQFNNQFGKYIKQLNEKLKPVQQVAKQLERFGEQFKKSLSQIDFSKILDNYLAPMRQFAIKIEEAKKDPDSLINYMSYVKNLSNYFWAMPYEIDTSELKEIFENVNSEKEFDDYMRRYFNKQKLKCLFEDIKKKVSRKHIVIFRQIEQGFYSKQYSLINTAIISIIDDELSYYTYNKGETKRKNLFVPIIQDFLKKSIKECDWLDLFYLEMLNNNLNLLFDNVDFKNIVINNNKAIRRHTVQHGKKYNNQRIVSIMLLNTLYNLLYIKDDLKEYKNNLKIKRAHDGTKYYVLSSNKNK